MIYKRGRNYKSIIKTQTTLLMKFSALMLATAANAIKVAHTSQDACKCLTTTPSSIIPYLDGSGTYYQLVEIDGESIEYPTDYGIDQCAAHDEFLYGFGCADEDGHILDDAPVYCAEPWCYVSPECSLYDDLAESSIYVGFVLSYNKCGGDVNGSADEEEVVVEEEDDCCDGCGGNDVNIDIDFNVNVVNTGHSDDDAEEVEAATEGEATEGESSSGDESSTDSVMMLDPAAEDRCGDVDFTDPDNECECGDVAFGPC